MNAAKSRADRGARAGGTSWMVLVAVLLGVAAAWAGLNWGMGDARAQGAADDLASAAGMLVAAAAFLIVFGLGALLIGLLVSQPGRGAARVVTVVLSLLLVAGGVGLFAGLYPVLLR